MPFSPQFDRFASSCATPSSIIGSPRRLTLAASLLGEARALEAACRAAPSFRRASADPHTGSFEVAVQLYEDGQWTAAYAAAAMQADSGHPAAARLALLMLRHGATLYQIAFTADPRRLVRWAKTVIAATHQTNLVTGSFEARSSADQRPLRSTSRRTASPNSITAIA